MPQSHQDRKLTQREFLPLSNYEEEIGKAVVNAAFLVHKELGPGLLEKVYEACFCHVLTEQGFIKPLKINRKKIGFLN